MAKTILIVDDAQTVRHLTRFALSKGGYNIIEAEDGVQGLKALEKNAVDLIISDLNMPNMNGLDMCRSIKSNERLKHIPIFMMTTESSQEMTLQGKEIGIMAWIVKPFVPEKLLAAVHRVVGG
ncbi:MAG: response regulator [Betaproteobacteria bacterium]|nr:response regulator [Betaproteobacteria bacterium]